MYIVSKPHSIWGHAAISLENQRTVNSNRGDREGPQPQDLLQTHQLQVPSLCLTPLRRLEIHLLLRTVTRCTYQRDV